jgi:ATP-binding cassette subfamily F protein 3
VGYLSQIQGATLKDSKTILDEFIDAGFKTYEDIRSYISKNCFEGSLLSE